MEYLINGKILDETLIFITDLLDEYINLLEPETNNDICDYNKLTTALIILQDITIDMTRD